MRRVTTGNSETGGVVLARLRAPDGDDYAVLRLAGDKRLKVVQRPAAQGAKGSYSVRIWY